jgi:hypothetical protein
MILVTSTPSGNDFFSEFNMKNIINKQIYIDALNKILNRMNSSIKDITIDSYSGLCVYFWNYNYTSLKRVNFMFVRHDYIHNIIIKRLLLSRNEYKIMLGLNLLYANYE